MLQRLQKLVIIVLRVVHTGVYQTIDAPRCLVFTWNSPHAGDNDSPVTVEFLPDGKATEVVITHQRLPEAARAGYIGGWTEILRAVGADNGSQGGLTRPLR